MGAVGVGELEHRGIGAYRIWRIAGMRIEKKGVYGEDGREVNYLIISTHRLKTFQNTLLRLFA